MDNKELYVLSQIIRGIGSGQERFSPTSLASAMHNYVRSGGQRAAAITEIDAARTDNPHRGPVLDRVLRGLDLAYSVTKVN